MKRKGFFNQVTRPEDPAAAVGAVEALFVPRRSALQDLSIDRIHPSPYQARQTFDAIDELAGAIRVQGFVTRLRVRPHPEKPGHFQLVYGERRLRAARVAGLAEVPCEIADHTDEEMIEIGLTENLQRRDLDPLEEANALQAVIERRGYTISALADRLGKSKGYVNNRLALLRAPEDVRDLVSQRPHTLRAALDVDRLEGEERARMIEELRSGAMSGNQVREQVRDAARAAAPDSRESLGQLQREHQVIIASLRRWRGLAARSAGETREFLLYALEELISEAEGLAEDMES